MISSEFQTLMLTRVRETDLMRQSGNTIFSTLNELPGLMLIAQSEIAKTYNDNPKVIGVNELNIDHVIEALTEKNIIKSIKFVVSASEDFVILAAQIREKLGIHGQSYKSALAYRNKFVMKEYLRGSKTFTSPKYWSAARVAIEEEVFDTKKKYILKPLAKSASEQIEILTAKDLASINLEGCILEEFVALPMLHVDGLVSNCEMQFAAVSKYINTPIAFKDKKFIGSEFSTDEVLNARVITATQEVIQLLPSPTCFAFHAEFFYSDDQLVFCEIASRPGGGGIIGSIEEAFGFNLIKQSLYLGVGCRLGKGISNKLKNYTFWMIVPYGIAISVDIDAIRKLNWVVQVSYNYDKKNVSNNSVEANFTILITAESENELQERRENIFKMLSLNA